MLQPLPSSPPAASTPLADHAYRVAIEERIADLWRFRAWYRSQANWGHWMELAMRNDIELRALVFVARRARRATRLAVVR